MPDKLKIAKAILATAVASELVVAQINKRRHHRNIEKFNNLVAELETAEKRVDYLIHVLDENEVPADEFDAIVFNSLM